MPVAKRRVVTKFTKSILARNQKLLTVLEHMEGVRAISALTIPDLLTAPTSVTSARNFLRELSQHGLIVHSHVEGDTLRNNALNFWKITEGAVERARQIFVVEDPRPQKVVVPKKPKNIDVRKPKPVSTTSIRRDPLTMFLMGVGRAPSLNFRDSVEKDRSCL